MKWCLNEDTDTPTRRSTVSLRYGKKLALASLALALAASQHFNFFSFFFSFFFYRIICCTPGGDSYMLRYPE